MNNERNLKVLISAYACEPHKGSEPGVGWNWAKQIAGFAEVHVITRANNRAVIEEELKKSPISNLYFHYYDVPRWLSFWKKKTRGLYLYYLLWQFGAYRLAKKIHNKEKFDIVHHLTFGNIWLPTFMPFLGISFIWGPVGGGEQIPKEFRRYYYMGATFQESLRDIILSVLRFNPFFLLNLKMAAMIIVRTRETFKKIPFRYQKKTLIMIETGVQKAVPFLTTNKKEKVIIQVISVGRLIHCKGFDLAIRAFAKAFNNDEARLIIIGDGPDRKRLEELATEEGVKEKIVFMGHLDHDKTLQYMNESAIFLFPSLKEGGAWVLFEALMLGLPIVCLDIAGSKEVVHNDCGIKIKPVTPDQTVDDLSKALLRLAEDSDLRRRLGEAGKRYVMEHHTWEKKGEFIRQVYEKVMSNGV